MKLATFVAKIILGAALIFGCCESTQQAEAAPYVRLSLSRRETKMECYTDGRRGCYPVTMVVTERCCGVIVGLDLKRQLVIVTCAHVAGLGATPTVELCPENAAVLSDRKEPIYKAKIVYADVPQDVAIAVVEGTAWKGYETVRLAQVAAVEGTRLIAYGAASGQFVATPVLIRGYYKLSIFEGQARQWMAFTPCCRPGDSGGPILGTNGDLFGLMSVNDSISKPDCPTGYGPHVYDIQRALIAHFGSWPIDTASRPPLAAGQPPDDTTRIQPEPPRRQPQPVQREPPAQPPLAPQPQSQQQPQPQQQSQSDERLVSILEMISDRLDALEARRPESGQRGADGAAGAVGPAGPAGAQGLAGPVGPQGTKGEQGPQGRPGLIGPKGDDGATGPAGPPGPQGITGVAGPRGATGERGPAGATGPAGSVGPRGPQGPPGSPDATVLSTLAAIDARLRAIESRAITVELQTLDGQTQTESFGPGQPIRLFQRPRTK